MPEDEKLPNEIVDEELEEIAGGGTYNKEGYLRTVGGYNCDYSEPKAGYDGVGCTYCRWHKTLLCTNPKNKRS